MHLVYINIEKLYNDRIKVAFNPLKSMLSPETLLNYPCWGILFTIHTDAYEKQLGDIISQYIKPIKFFCRILSNTRLIYTTTKKELLSIVEFL